METKSDNVSVIINYTSTTLMTAGRLNVFNVFFDNECIIELAQYDRNFTYEVITDIGKHLLEVKMFNTLTKIKKKPKIFEIELPHSGKYEIGLKYDNFWGGWRKPIVKLAQKII